MNIFRSDLEDIESMFVVRILTQNVYERFWYLAIFTTFINPCPRGYEANVIVVVLFPAIIISGWCMARTRVLVNGILRRVNVVVASVRMKIRVSISATMHVGGTRLREELAVRARKDVGRDRIWPDTHLRFSLRGLLTRGW